MSKSYACNLISHLAMRAFSLELEEKINLSGLWSTTTFKFFPHRYKCNFSMAHTKARAFFTVMLYFNSAAVKGLLT